MKASTIASGGREGVWSRCQSGVGCLRARGHEAPEQVFEPIIQTKVFTLVVEKLTRICGRL